MRLWVVPVVVCASRVALADPACVTVDDHAAVTVATAAKAGEYVLTLDGQSASATSTRSAATTTGSASRSRCPRA